MGSVFRIAACAAAIVHASWFAPLRAGNANDPIDAAWIRAHYAKHEHRIPMRDGVRLFTSVYVPIDAEREVPILLLRTPYGVKPYGPEAYREDLGPTPAFAREGYIFAFQDVRGTYLSEGDFDNMRPHLADKRGPRDVDESTDTFDTIGWLLRNVPGHNGRVGQWGISYPGFYAAAGMIDGHPSLVAVSPQAPIADWWFDDFHHHGAFFLPHAFNFFVDFGRPRPEPTADRPRAFSHGTNDGYRWFLDLGPLSNAYRHFPPGGIPFWDELARHPNYDAFWQRRNLLPHLRNVRAAVLTVGGWFDAEDLHGPLEIYAAVERSSPATDNRLVMGPWSHGAWNRSAGDRLGHIAFGAATSAWFQENVQLPFFEQHLRREPRRPPDLAEATVFETGTNRWRRLDAWPPRRTGTIDFHLRAGGRLDRAPPGSDEPAYSEFTSDPARPVPATERIHIGMPKEYMTDDQRFAARRPDVLVFESGPLDEALTLAGPLVAEIWVSTSAGDADWVVKLIDVFPPETPEPEPNPTGVELDSYQMLVRGEVFRGRFRESYERPVPFEPGVPAEVRFELRDIFHTFGPGHRVMVQVQSSWFPLVDRNPQRFVPNIFEARAEDFVPATHRLYHDPARPSRLRGQVFH